MRRALFLIVVLLSVVSTFGQSRRPGRQARNAPSIQANNITPANPQFCAGGNVVLTATAPPANHSFQWRKGAANVGANSSTYTATAPGAYTVFAFTATDTVYYDTVTVVENPNPSVDFAFSNNNSCAGTNVGFTSQPSGGTAPYTYAWDFGNGVTSGAANPTKSFSPPFGCSFVDSTVALKVTDSKGCIASVGHPVRVKQKPDVSVKDAQNPFAQFNNCSHNPSAANPNFLVLVENTSVSSSCITTYTIDWGDGTPQSVVNTSTFSLPHTYTSIQQYTLTVTAQSDNGCSNSKTYKVVNQSNPAVGIGASGNTTGCAPIGFSFNLTNYTLNSSGTYYTWTFGDGSSDTVWNTGALPSPANIFHLFDTTSCNSPNQQFVVKVTATNGCKSTTATVDNITIFKKPKANFTNPASACVNSSVQFTNNSIAAYNEGSCSRETLYEWNFGDGGTSSAESPTHAYTTAGTYTIRLIAQGSCGKDTTYKPICIVANPIPSYTVDNLTGCAPFTVNTTNTSSTLTACVAATYGWSTNYSATNCGNSAASTFENGSTASSINASIQFTNPGTYSLKLSVTNACGTVTDSKSIVVKTKPSVSLTAIANGCAPYLVSPTASVTNCGANALTYAWTFNGGSPVSSGSLTPGQVEYASAGNYTIDLAATNECGQSTASRSFIVSVPPNLTVPAPVKVCTGVVVSGLTSSSSTSGVTYSWSASPTSIGLSTSNGSGASLPTFTATNNGSLPVTATITVVASSTTCTTTKSFTITVYPKPAAPTASTSVPYCQNAPASPLTATPSASHSLLWYTVSSGGAGTGTAPVPSTATTGTTSYWVSQVNDTTSCEGPRTKIDVTVKPTPVITAVPHNPTSCGGSNGSIVISGLTNGSTYTISYVRNGTTTQNNIVASGTTYTIGNLNAGTYDGIQVTLNGCPSSAAGPFTLSDPSAPAAPTATANGPICAGSGLQLNASTVPNAVYSWSGPNAYSSSQQNPLLSNATTAASGTYSVTVTVAGCASPAGTVNATVNPKPATPTVSAPDVCSGSTLTLTANSTTPGVTYGWTGPGGFTANTAIATVPNAPTTASGTYTVTATLGTCSSSAIGIPTVKPTPVISATPNNPTSCGGSNGSIVLSGLSSGTYTISYKRNGTTVSIPGQSVSGTSFTIANLSAATYSEIMVTLNGCTSNQEGPFTLSDPSAPAAPTATAAASICSGSNLQLNAGTVANASYSWSGPNSFSSALQNPLISAAGTAATGTYSVTVTVAGCSSPAGTVTVTVNQTPATPSASAPAVCSGNTLTLTASSSTAGVTYGWTGPNGFTANTAVAAVPGAGTNASGNYTVTATLGSCSSNAVVAATVKPTPQITATPANPTTCGGTSGTILISGLTAGNYTVSYERNSTPVTLSNLSVTGTTYTITGLDAATYDHIKVTLNGCPSNEAGPFTLSDPSAPAAPVASSNGPICAGNLLQLNAGLIANATYSWSGPNSFSSALQNPSVSSATTAATGTYSVTVTVNGCASPAGTVTVTVNPTPAQPTISSNEPVCSGNTLTLNAASTTAGALTWSWTGPGSYSSTLQNISFANATTAQGGTYTVTATLGSCPSAPRSLNVTVKPTPVISASLFSDPTNCATSTGTITLKGLAASTTYQVTYTRNSGTPTVVPLASNASGDIVITGLPAGTYDAVSVSLNGCPSAPVGPFQLHDPNPPATPVAGNGGPVCSGNPLNLTATSDAGATYTWSGPGGYSNSSQNPVINNIALTAAGTYSVTATVNGCTSAPATTTVVVNETPALPTVSSPAVCSGNTLTLTANSATAAVSYTWSGPAGFASAVQNPTISGATSANAGDYTVVVTLGSCTSTATTNAVVKPTPVLSATPANPTNCNTATGSITLQGLTAPGTYTVTYTANGSPVTLTNQTPSASGVLQIPNLASGVYDHIRVTVNGCPSNEVGPFSLTDPNPPATPTATNSGPVCTGNNLTLNAASTTPGVTYSWSGPGSYASSSQNPALSNVGLSDAGTYSVTATLNGCTSAAGSTTVVVNPTPVAPTVTIPPACSGTLLSLNASSPTAGVTYSWSGPASFSSSQQNTTIPNASSVHAGTYTVIATLGPCSATGTGVAVVKPTPAITGTFTNPATCNSSTGSITLSGLTPGTYTLNYRASGNPVTVPNQTPAANGTLVIGNLPAGVYDAITVTLDGCPSNEVGPFNLQDPNPPATPVVSNSGPVCSGTNLTLNASSDAGVTWTWSGPNGFSSNQQNPVVTGVLLADAGTYSVTATLNGCTSAAGNTTAVVNLTPAVPAVSSPDVCSGNTLTLNASSATPNVTYAWTGPAGFASALQNPTIAAATAVHAGVYTVTVTLGTCSSTATVTAVVKPTPVITGSFSNPTNCNTPTGSLSVSGLAAGTYTVQYTFNGAPQTVTNQTPNASGTITITGLAAGLYEHLRVVLSGCPSNETGPFTLQDPNPPAAPVVGSNSPICFGGTLSLTANGVAGGSYAWSGPNSFASSLQNPSIVTATTAATGTYTVTVTLNNCTSPAATLNAVVNPLPAAPGATSPVLYCKDVAPVALTATADAGATLNWYTAATGGTPAAIAPVPQTATPGSTMYYVSQTSAAQCEGPRTPIQVQVNPDADARFTFARDTACWPFVLDIQNISTAASNSSYQWYTNNALLGTSTGAFPGYTIPTPSTGVTLKLVALSAFGCKPDSMEHTFRTLPKPDARFTASTTTGCGPLSVTFTNTTPLVDTFRYAWDFGNGQFSAATQPGTIVFASAPTANDTTYHVVLKAFNECDTTTFRMDIGVSSKPKALFTPDHTTGCSPMDVTFANTSLGIGNNYVWIWDDGTPNTVSSTRDPVTHTFHTAVQDTFYVKLAASNQCGTDTAVYAIVVAPNPIRLFMAVNGPQQNGCAPHSVQFINNTVGATGFQWNFGDGNTLNTTQGIDTVTHTFLTAGAYSVQLTAFNGCTDTTMTLTINVFPKPFAGFSADRYSVCIGDSIHFTNNSSGATSYLWQFGDGNVSTLTNVAHAYTTPNTYPVKLIAYRLNAPGNVCSDSLTVPVQVVASLPGAISLSDSVSSCVPFSVTFTNPNVPAAVTTWNFGDGNSGAGSPVSHIYQQAGTYLATLTSIAPGGCTYTAERRVRINAPAGSFSYPAGYVCGARSVRFDATVSGTDTLIWNFGDGHTQSTLQPFTFYTYPNPGLYVPSVTLASVAGCHLLLPGTDTIKVDRIVAGYTASADRRCGSTLVTFTDTSHVFFGISSVRWDFGDGTSAAGPLVQHQYTSTGQYNIRQIVLSNSGCSDTVLRVLNVVVSGIPDVTIAADALGCARISTNLFANVNSIDPVTLYEWTVNGNVQSAVNPYVATFATPGTYNIRVIVGTVNGCFDTAFHTMEVRPSPIVTATPAVDLCLGRSTQLGASGAGVVQWSWSPVQGLSCTTCPNPVATPNGTTTYTVTGTNAFGCPGYATVLVTIHGPVHMTVSDDDSICVGQSVQLLASGAATYVWRPDQYLDNDSIPNPLATPPVTTRYQVVGYDGWNCYTDTASVLVAVGEYPTVNLGPDLVLATGTQRPLATTVTNGPIRNWNWTPATDLSCSNCPLPTATVRNDVTYTVQVTTFYGCSAADTLVIKAFCKDAQVFLPNAFSPDGDGVNDVFLVQGSGILRVKTFRIFNRWGELVYEKNEVPPNDPRFGWDGRVIGRPPVPDVYVYTVEVLCENGIPYTYKGNVTILK